MTKLILVRHGHVEGIQPERFRGRRDVPLTAEGRRQAVAAAHSVADRWRPVAVYTSPLQRCVQTGAEIAKACKVAASPLDDLNDLNYGEWQWRLHTEIRAENPRMLDQWFRVPHLVRFPQGESLQDLVARTANVIRLAIERHPANTVVLVGHDSGIRAMLLQLLDVPLSGYWRFAQDSAAISEVDVLVHGGRVISLNETLHLRTEGA